MGKKVGVILLMLASVGYAQEQLPVIDMHMHALAADSEGPPPLGMCTPIDPFPAWDPATPYPDVFLAMLKKPNCKDPVWSPESDEDLLSRTIEVMERRNVFGVLSGTPERVAQWMDAAPDRFIPAIHFMIGRAELHLSVESLTRLHAEQRMAVFGEIVNQYAGIAPSDERMEPYWSMAEELDIPVGIHIGTGPPGVIYLGSSGYRARLHSALSLEEVLVSHPGLRVYIMHAGFPMLDDLLATMYAHPQVYVDVGVIVYTQPRNVFYRYLRGITEAGFANRVMFGSDQMVWPEVIERSIRIIEDAPFLTSQQKRGILYNNAARFLRLSEEEIARHHGKQTNP